MNKQICIPCRMNHIEWVDTITVFELRPTANNNLYIYAQDYCLNCGNQVWSEKNDDFNAESWWKGMRGE